jgi:cobalamin biosynthesis protein CbiM
MHIMEGFLPPAHALGWTLVSAPFLAWGLRTMRRDLQAHPERRMLLGVAAAFAFLLSALKPARHIVFTTLDSMADADIGMLSTVLIGNSNTFIRHGLMVTPRGYANKYDMDDGGATRAPATEENEA